MQRRAAGGQTDDANNKPQRPKKPQNLSGEKVKTLSTKVDEGKASEAPPIVRAQMRRPSYSDLEAAPTIKVQERPQSLPVTAAPAINAFEESYRASYAASANEVSLIRLKISDDEPLMIDPQSQSSEAGQIELLRVRSLILEAGYDFADLRGRSGETAEDAVTRLLEQYRKLNISLQEAQLRLADAKSTDDQTKPPMRKDLNMLKDKLRYTLTELKDCETAVHDRDKDLSRAEGLIKTMVTKHEKDSKRYKSKIKDLEQQLDRSAAEISKLQEEQRVSASDETASEVLRQDIQTLHLEIHSLKSQNAELVSAHTATLKKEADAWVAERNELKANYERQLSDLRGEMFMKSKKDQHLHDKAMEDLQQYIKEEQMKWATHMHTLKAELEGRMMDRDQDANKRLRDQERKYAETFKAEQANFEKKIKKLETQLRQQQTHLQEAQKSNEERRADEQRRLEKELRRQSDSLKGKYENEQHQLRSAVEDLKGALVAKEHFKGLTDSEISSRFTKLAQEVEDFARLEWDPAREAEWLTPQLQRLQPRNTRKLKQAIVQNSVWVGLREHVFSSPFKMFAEEDGWRESDSPWIDIYSLSKLIKSVLTFSI